MKRPEVFVAIGALVIPAIVPLIAIIVLIALRWW